MNRKLCAAVLCMFLICGMVQSHAEQIDVVDEWYVVRIEDEWVETLITMCEETGELNFHFSVEVIDEARMLGLQLTLQEEEPLVEYLWMPGIDKVFFSPTHMYTDAEAMEYYYVRNKMFLIENTKYNKWNMYVLSDDSFIWFNKDHIREKMFYFMRTDNE